VANDGGENQTRIDCHHTCRFHNVVPRHPTYPAALKRLMCQQVQRVAA